MCLYFARKFSELECRLERAQRLFHETLAVPRLKCSDVESNTETKVNICDPYFKFLLRKMDYSGEMWRSSFRELSSSSSSSGSSSSLELEIVPWLEHWITLIKNEKLVEKLCKNKGIILNDSTLSSVINQLNLMKINKSIKSFESIYGGNSSDSDEEEDDETIMKKAFTLALVKSQ